MTTINKDSKDTEYLLHHDDLHLRVSPFGASVRGLWHGADDDHRTIITEFSGAENNIGSQGEVLMPFPSRIPDGRYTFAGQTHYLSVKDGTNHAMHGFLRGVLWETTERTETAVTFAITVSGSDFPGYPFALRVTVRYQLEPAGLRCDFRAENSGDTDAPFGAGFHPYFTVGSPIIDSDRLQVPFQEQVQIQDGKRIAIAETAHDFRTERTVGSLPADAVYTAPLRDSDGRVRVRFAVPDNARVVTVWMDKTFDYLVLYSGDTQVESFRRRALAIEPWTCAPNAFNYPERGLTVLAPGESLSGSWGVEIK